MADFRALCVELVRIADALDGRSPLISNQGQALDGCSVLAAFRTLAHRARAALAEPESVQDRIAAVDAAIETSMERIRALAAPAYAAHAPNSSPSPPSWRASDVNLDQ